MRTAKIGIAAHFLIALAAATFLASGSLQAQEPAIVIEGGTLIDGNGGAPVRDSVVVIQGNKILRVGVKGQGTYPAGARVIQCRRQIRSAGPD